MNELNGKYLYLVRVDSASFILDSTSLKQTLKFIQDERQIVIMDIAGNYLSKPFDNKVHFSYQKLYNIRHIELEGERV